MNKPDILDVLRGEGAELRQRGRRWWSLCLFHTEKTPSLSANPELGLYYCFGCGKGGDAITLVRELHGLTFPEAIHYLDIKPERHTKEKTAIVDRHKRLLAEFRRWEKTKRDELAALIRLFRQKQSEGFTEAELEIWFPVICEFSYLEYLYDVISGNDDAEKIELYRREMIEDAGYHRCAR